MGYLVQNEANRVFFLGGGSPFYFPASGKNRGRMYVPSVLRFIFIAQTVQRSRLLVGFHQVSFANY